SSTVWPSRSTTSLSARTLLAVLALMLELDDLDLDALRRRGGVKRHHAQVGQHALRSGFDRRLLVRARAVFARTVADAHDVAVATTILEVAEHRPGQGCPFDETAEGLGELGPVAAQDGLV